MEIKAILKQQGPVASAWASDDLIEHVELGEAGAPEGGLVAEGEGEMPRPQQPGSGSVAR